VNAMWSMIGSLLNLTVTRPDIHFSVCLCTRFQVSPRTSHRQASNGSSSIFDILLSSVFGTRRPLPFCFMVFQMPTLQGVESIGNRLWVLASFWDLRLFRGPLTNNLV
jgi:hypothetical protein